MFGRIADSRTISIWLIGYYAGMRNNSVIDVAAVQKSSQDLMHYCMAHSEVSCDGRRQKPIQRKQITVPRACSVPRRRSDGQGQLLRADRALDFCERLFTGGVVAGAIGRASARHGFA